MFGIGFQELIVIFLIILLLFGAKRLPEIARGLGRSIREFKKATTHDDQSEEKSSEIEKQEKQQ